MPVARRSTSEFAALSPRWWESLVVLLSLSPIFGVLLWQARKYEGEDALIYFRFLRNFRQHGELVYNLGDRVNGLTSSLWTLLLMIITPLSEQPVAFANLVCALLFVAAAGIFYNVIAELAGRLAGCLTALLLLTSPYFPTCFGLETSLFLFLLAISVRLWLSEKLGWLALTLGLLLITRSEAVFFVAAVVLNLWRRPRRPSLWSQRYHLLALGLPLAAATIVKGLYYGQTSPHTALAKFGQGYSGFWGSWPTAFVRIGYQLSWFYADRLWVVVPLLLLVAIGVWRLRGSRLSRLLGPFLGMYTATFVLLNVPNYHWYYAAFHFFGLAYAAVGLATTWHAARSIVPLQRRALAASSVMMMALAIIAGTTDRSWQLSKDAGPRPYYRAASWFLVANTPQNATVAAVEIGTLGWYSHRPIVDILGLVSEDNARAIMHRDLTSWLTHYRPDYVLVHDPLWPLEEAMRNAELRGDYTAVPEFQIASLRLLKRRAPALGK